MGNVVVKKVNRNIKVEQVTRNVTLKRPKTNITVNQVGRRGPKGDDGRVYEVHAGAGVIVNNSDPANPVVSATGGSGDKNFTQSFTAVSSLSVQHNLQKLPSVQVINSAGDEVIGDINYIDINNLIVMFSAPFSGQVTCN